MFGQRQLHTKHRQGAKDNGKHPDLSAVLLAASLKIGAILGNASSEDANRLYNFGINIGIAFQLKDDLYLEFFQNNHFSAICLHHSLTLSFLSVSMKRLQQMH